MVKVGHKQVVSMIRQGGNNLLMKVVTVSRKPELEDGMRKKGQALVNGNYRTLLELTFLSIECFFITVHGECVRIIAICMRCAAFFPLKEGIELCYLEIPGTQAK